MSEDRYTYTTYTNTERKGAITSEVIRTVFQSKTGQIWVGTDGGGLCKVKEQSGGKFTFSSYSKNAENAKSISNNTVLTIFEDERGLLWLGTFGGGLNVFNPKTEEFFAYTEKKWIIKQCYLWYC